MNVYTQFHAFSKVIFILKNLNEIPMCNIKNHSFHVIYHYLIFNVKTMCANVISISINLHMYKLKLEKCLVFIISIRKMIIE